MCIFVSLQWVNTFSRLCIFLGLHLFLCSSVVNSCCFLSKFKFHWQKCPGKLFWDACKVLEFFKSRRVGTMKLDGCIVWNAHNTVFSSAICAQALYFLHSTRPSVTWLNSRCDWLPATEWGQRYLPCCQPASDVSKKFGSTFHVRTVLASGFWIDSNGKNGN